MHEFENDNIYGDNEDDDDDYDDDDDSILLGEKYAHPLMSFILC